MEDSSVIKFKNIFGTFEKEILLELTDAKLKTEDNCIFDVHRVILARNNEYFSQLFCSFSGKDKREFLINGVSGEVLSEILIFLYIGQTTLTSLNVTKLMAGADYLIIDDLSKEIQKGINELLHLDNCVHLLVRAHQINSTDIFNAAFRFIEINFATVVEKHKALLAELPMELLHKLLCSASLRTFDERPVWDAIVEWVQKDLQHRLSSVPDLLNHLAWKEVDDILVDEIVSHNIVKTNSYCTISDYQRSSASFSNLQKVVTHLDHSLDYRNPPKMYVAAQVVTAANFERNYYIYVTHDEQLDVWRKIAELKFYPDKIIPMNNILYIISERSDCCLRLDLQENSFLQPFSFNKIFSALRVEKVIYVFGANEEEERTIDGIDWDGTLRRNIIPYFSGDIIFPGISLFSRKDIRMVGSISGKMYVIGQDRNDGRMVVQVCNPKSPAWSYLRSPEVRRSLCFYFTVYHEKIFLIGGGSSDGISQPVEIYDPNSQNWRRVADVPVSLNWSHADVWEDRLVVYDNPTYAIPARTLHVWNELQECWEAMDRSHPLSNILIHLFSFQYRVVEICDAETIRVLSKRNQYHNIEVEKCDLNFQLLRPN